MLRLWLASQRRCGSSQADDTEARLQELCAAEGWSADGSDGEEDEEEVMDNSEPLDDSDVYLSDSGRECRPLSGILSLTSLDIWIHNIQVIVFLFILTFDMLDDNLEGYDKMVSGRRKTGRVSLVISCHFTHASPHFCVPRHQCFLPYVHIRFPALVEQEEREGWDVSSQSMHWWKPEAGPVPGRTGEKKTISILILFSGILLFIGNVQNQD